MYGKSKDKMRPIMTDLEHKCHNYRKAREATRSVQGHHAVVPAEEGAVVWRKNTTTEWTGYNAPPAPDKIPKKKK